MVLHTLRWRWIRMYFGHRTKRPRSRLTRMSPPMRNDLGSFLKSGFLEEAVEPPFFESFFVLILRERPDILRRAGGGSGGRDGRPAAHVGEGSAASARRAAEGVLEEERAEVLERVEKRFEVQKKAEISGDDTGRKREEDDGGWLRA